MGSLSLLIGCGGLITILYLHLHTESLLQVYFALQTQHLHCFVCIWLSLRGNCFSIYLLLFFKDIDECPAEIFRFILHEIGLKYVALPSCNFSYLPFTIYYCPLFCHRFINPILYFVLLRIFSFFFCFVLFLNSKTQLFLFVKDDI